MSRKRALHGASFGQSPQESPLERSLSTAVLALWSRRRLQLVVQRASRPYPLRPPSLRSHQLPGPSLMNNFQSTSVRPSSIPEPLVLGSADAFLAEYLEYWAGAAPDSMAHTFIDYAESRQGIEHTLTYAELDVRTRALAARLMQITMPGDRVALLIQQGTDFIVGFLGALRTQVINVPLFAPDMPGQGN